MEEAGARIAAILWQHASHHEECLSPTMVYLTLRDGNARTLGNDQVAVHDRGMHVTDDSYASQFVRPSLTSISFGDGNTLGQLAVEMLVNQFTDQSSTLARSLPLSPQLTPRSSS